MKRRRIFLVLLALGLVAGASAGGILWWRRGVETTPQPPRVDLENANDPTLERVVERTRQDVLREPRSAAAWGKLGKVLLANGYFEEAIPCFEQAAHLDPQAARWPYFQGLAQRQNNLDAALRCFRSADRLGGASGPHAFSIRMRYAEALLSAGNAEEGGRVLRDLARLEPDEPRVHLALGALAADANDLDKALSHLLACADHPLTRQRAATHLAQVYARKSNPGAAAKYRNRARQLPRDPEASDPFVEEYMALAVGRHAVYLHAVNYLRAGELQKAVQMLQPLVDAYPDEVEARVKLGLAWAKLGNYAQAESVLRQALAVSPGTVQAHYFLCVALFHQAERSGARAGFKMAAEEARQTVKLKPDHAYAHLYLGLALRKLDEKEAGLVELRQAVRFSPESTDPQLHLGEALLEAGQKKDGLLHLEKAAEIAGDEDARPRAALRKWRKAMKSIPR